MKPKVYKEVDEEDDIDMNDEEEEEEENEDSEDEGDGDDVASDEEVLSTIVLTHKTCS